MSFSIETWTIQQETGYRPITTFYTDFSIADHFGVDAILDTYHRAFKEWKSNYEYLTELVMVLNHKCWRWYQVKDNYSKLYADLYYQLHDWCLDNLKGDELTYYIRTTD